MPIESIENLIFYYYPDLKIKYQKNMLYIANLSERIELIDLNTKIQYTNNNYH